MWRVDLQDRETCETVVEAYASGFESYAEACAWGNAQEIEIRRCGWMYVVVPMGV